MTARIASLTSGKSFRRPEWNSIGASSTIRYWLKLNPTSPGSASGVLMRKIPAAISVMFVPDCVFVIMSGLPG